MVKYFNKKARIEVFLLNKAFAIFLAKNSDYSNVLLIKNCNVVAI